MLKQAKNNIVFVVLSLLLLVLLVLIGPMNAFQHGYYANEVDVSTILKDDLAGTYDLIKSEYTTTFIPAKKHMTGVEVYIVKQDSTQGSLILTIEDSNGKIIDHSEVEVSNVKSDTWYKFYTKAKYKIGGQYTLHISASGTNGSITLQKATTSYMSEENRSGEALLSFAYKKSTFSIGERALICMLIFSFWMILLARQLKNSKSCTLKLIGICGVLVTFLSWNYFFNSIDKSNISFDYFQADSEALNTSIIYAEKDVNYYSDDKVNKYGLARYSTIAGEYYGWVTAFVTDDNWDNGYSREETAILLSDNPYTAKVAMVGNKLQFQNGDILKISKVSKENGNIKINFENGNISLEKNGSLRFATFLDSDGNTLPKGSLNSYVSQYGLQGKIFRLVFRVLHNGELVVRLSQLMVSLFLAITVVLLCALIKKKYNMLMASCFFLVLWLSPWVVNFARNLYWVEFTWFIPMVIGLFCSVHIESKKVRIISYFLTFIAILIKCLCGYEYISTIMMGLITFLLADLLQSLISKDKEKAILIFRTTFIIGTFAIIGFLSAVCMHAQLRGDGNILEGLVTIFKNDVLRRTSGADLNVFASNLWDSINASKWEVLCNYFHFNTEIITGIPGKLFQVMCFIPLGIFIYDYSKKVVNLKDVSLYVITFLTSISWIVLAKSHSYIHTHISFVLWYFGYVQVCLYIIFKKFIQVIKRTDLEN
ncbi:hypothetical protein [uncultured Solobacterium sp.]|uniref:hypothetical protein n=1 Tax=uncultured Solobacterium sp. TaxID=747375 RepID=UPI0028D37EBF|nr:hypothetical protein [uncultured Solobacterium sp.]